jgi:hypothetical protein
MKKVPVILLFLIGLYVVASVLLPFHIFPSELLFIPKDKQIVSAQFDQKLPGYSHIEILEASGSGRYSDPRLINVRAMIESGEKSIACKGKAYYYPGDPGGRGFMWETLECEGLSELIWMTQSSISSSYDPTIVWYPPYLSCFKNQIASVLYYWVKQGKTTLDAIGWPEIKSIVEDMLAGKVEVNSQIVLFDPSEKEVIDLAPQTPADQKVKQYYLRCDGILREYLAQTNMDIYNNLKSSDVFVIHLPLSEIKSLFGK